jgi:hypothetical protein
MFPLKGLVVFRVLYISVRNVVLVNDWNVECDWLPFQTDLVSARMSFTRSRKLMWVVACISCSVLVGECLDFSDSSSLEELSLDDSDSLSLVDLTLISVPSLLLGDGSVRSLDDSSSELDRVGFGFWASSSLLRC